MNIEITDPAVIQFIAIMAKNADITPSDFVQDVLCKRMQQAARDEEATRGRSEKCRKAAFKRHGFTVQ